MFADLVRYVRLVHALWRGDLTRSITGSRAGTIAMEACLAGAAIGWVALAVATTSAGTATVPVPFQLDLVDDIVVGGSLVASSTACVAAVLMPPSRQLRTMLAAVPLSPVTRRLGPTLPALAVGVVAGPLVTAPLLATSFRVSGPVPGAVALLIVVVASVGAVLTASAVVRLLTHLGSRVGWGGVSGSSLATAVTLVGAVALAAFSRKHFFAALPTASSEGDLLALGAVRAVLAGVLVVAGIALTLVSARFRGENESSSVVRLLPNDLGKRTVELTLSLRDTTMISTLVLTLALVVLTRIALSLGSPWAPSLGVVLVVAAPSLVGMAHYGTDRSRVWRRNAAVPLGTDRWPLVTTVHGLAMSSAIGIIVAIVLHGAVAGPSITLVALLLLSTSAGVLAGVLVPSDLELPAAPLLAGIAAGGLTLGPTILLPRVLGDSADIAVGGCALVCTLVTPVAVRLRRFRSITA